VWKNVFFLINIVRWIFVWLNFYSRWMRHEKESNSDLLNNQPTDRPINQAIEADVIVWKKLSARVNVPIQFLSNWIYIRQVINYNQKLSDCLLIEIWPKFDFESSLMHEIYIYISYNIIKLLINNNINTTYIFIKITFYKHELLINEKMSSVYNNLRIILLLLFVRF